MNWSLFASVFFVIFIAELPDKTALAALVMAARGMPMAVFVGSALAFLIQSAVAVLFGRVLGILPVHWVHLGAGLMFLAFAIHAWFHSEKAEKSEKAERSEMDLSAHVQQPEATDSSQPASLSRQSRQSRQSFLGKAWAAFLMIFIAEWADLTQLATASMSARYPQSLWTVFGASVLALWAASALVILVGHRLKGILRGNGLRYSSVIIFSVVGIYFIVSGIAGWR